MLGLYAGYGLDGLGGVVEYRGLLRGMIGGTLDAGSLLTGYWIHEYFDMLSFQI